MLEIHVRNAIDLRQLVFPDASIMDENQVPLKKSFATNFNQYI